MVHFLQNINPPSIILHIKIITLLYVHVKFMEIALILNLYYTISSEEGLVFMAMPLRTSLKFRCC